MKGFLTFTLAAGVAITTTSIAQAAGVSKGSLNADRSAATQKQEPMSIGAMSGFSLDRAALNRELNRLSVLLEPEYLNEESGTGNQPVERKTSVGGWAGL